MKIKTGKTELTSLMINLICMKLFLSFPRKIIAAAGNAAWISSIIITLIALVLFFITDKVYRSDKSVIDIANRIGGTPFRIVTGIAVFIILTFNVCFTLRAFPESVRIILLQNSSMTTIVVLLAAAIAVGAYCGIESLARITSFFLPITAAVLMVFIILLFPHYRPDNLLPLFGKGYKAVFSEAMSGVSLFSDLIVLNILLPYAKSRDVAAKSGYSAIIVSGTAMTVILAAIGLIYPPELSQSFFMPVYQLTRLVSIGDFFSRVEAFFEFVWSVTMFLYASVYIFTLCIVWRDTFKLKFHKPLILPVTILCTGIAYIPSSVINAANTYAEFTPYIYVAVAIIPIFFGILERIKKRK